jgi:hypothetical protein
LSKAYFLYLPLNPEELHPKKYLSIIIAARNDNYGGDFLLRLQNSTTWNSSLLNNNKISTEYIIVDYNPDINSAALKDSLNLQSSEFVSYRFITVPNELHISFCNKLKCKPEPVLEFVAKNIGLRRAEGEYCLCSNADILLDPQFIAYLATRQLESDKVYRATRIDFTGETHLTSNEEYSTKSDIIKKNAQKIFLTGSINKIPSWLSVNSAQKIFKTFNKVRSLYYSFSSRFNHSVVRLIPAISKEHKIIFELPLSAAGDFTLMSKALWLNVGGYREDTWISAHTDALSILKIHSHGINIIELPFFAFHKDHNRRYDLNSKNPDIELMWHLFLEEVGKFQAQPTPINDTKENWGLNHLTLEEQIV